MKQHCELPECHMQNNGVWHCFWDGARHDFCSHGHRTAWTKLQLQKEADELKRQQELRNQEPFKDRLERQIKGA